MKKTRILAAIACGWVAALTGCDVSSSSPSSLSATSGVAGRASLDSGTVTATDANGDTIAKARLGHGGFSFHLPQGARFPLMLVVDSAGDTLRIFVPATDSGRQDLRIDRLTDSACRKLGADRHPPRLIAPSDWQRELEGLRPAMDSILRADSLARPAHHEGELRHPGDSSELSDSLRKPPPPPPSFGDSLRKPPPPPALGDSLRMPPPPPGIGDSLGMPPFPPMTPDSSKWHPMPRDTSGRR
jgi:hypothetical protein